MKILDELETHAEEINGDKYVYVEDLKYTGYKWIKHFMDRFDIAPAYLPVNVRLAPYGHTPQDSIKYTYGKSVNNKKDILTWTMGAMPKKDIDQKMPGLSIIAFIKFFFGIKDGEEILPEDEK